MIMDVTLNTSSSFRGSVKILEIIKKYSNFIEQHPSHTTIINWMHKIGLAQLTKAKKKANDWVIILDHSIQIGKEKVLVVLGIRESEIDFSKPLTYQNLQPITEVAKEHWTGETVKEELEKVKMKLGKIKYAVADYGSDIKKGLELSKIKHVYDLTHKIASTLKSLYKDNDEFISFTKKMSEIRKKCQQTDLAYLIPPTLRSKARYENIGPIGDWGKKIINYIENLNLGQVNKEEKDKINEKFNWVLDYKNLIKELNEINTTVKDFQKDLKTNGILTKDNIPQLEILNNLKSKNGILIKQKIREYISSTISNVKNRVTPILCSSDIIESSFGKYKNFVSSNPMAGITNLVLCIAAFTSSLSQEEIIRSLENFTINDVKNWTEENLGESLPKKRKEALCYSS